MLLLCPAPPVRNTFIHFTGPCGARRRTCSCPAEVGVDSVVAAVAEAASAREASRQQERGAAAFPAAAKKDSARAGGAKKEATREGKRKAAARRREEQERADMAFLEECRVEKVEELWISFDRRLRALRRRERHGAILDMAEQLRALWAIVVRKLLQREAATVLDEATQLLGEARVLEHLPRPRTACDKYAFKELVYLLFKSDPAPFEMLRSMGVVRERPHCYEVWCADAPLAEESILRRIIDMATAASRVQSARAFHVAIAGEPPLVFPWLLHMTLEGLQGILSDATQLAPEQYSLSHLGEPLRAGVSLADQGIRPGAFVSLVNVTAGGGIRGWLARSASGSESL